LVLPLPLPASTAGRQGRQANPFPMREGINYLIIYALPPSPLGEATLYTHFSIDEFSLEVSI
jgi:hypothetical protein